MHDWTPEQAAAHLTFDTTLNIDGIWGGYTGAGVATILPEKAAVKLDARLVPSQDVRQQGAVMRAHLDRHGFTDVEMPFVVSLSNHEHQNPVLVQKEWPASGRPFKRPLQVEAGLDTRLS